MLPRRFQKIERVMRARWLDIVVVLEDVHDPHNSAAVLRSCDAFGVQNVYFIFATEPKYNPRSIGKSSSSSANKWLTFETFSSTASCIKRLREQNYKIIVTALAARATSIYAAHLGGKIALVFGNEHRGISTDFLQVADLTLTIPMRGMVESLNISVTAGICLFEATRQRLKNNSQKS